MARARLSVDVHEKLTSELEQLLDERDEVDGKRRAISKVLRGELERIGEAIAKVRLRLKGATGLQTEIPGTEVGERRRSSEVMAILDAARQVRDAEEVETFGREAAAGAARGRPKRAKAEPETEAEE